MRTIKIILTALAVVVLGWWVLKTEVLEQNGKMAKVSRWAISGLMDRVTTGTVSEESEIKGQSGFKSYVVTYDSEGNKLRARMDIPDGKMPPSGWPVLILNHGHVAPSIYSTIDSYNKVESFYARAGYLVLKADYRGHDKSEGVAGVAMSRAEYAIDVLNLIEKIDSIKQADKNKIVMYGHSMGADVSLMVAEVSDKVKGLSMWAPAINNFPESQTFFYEKQGIPSTQSAQFKTEMGKLIDLYGDRPFSSLLNVNRIKIPVVVQHSKTDDLVPFGWGVGLVNECRRAGKNVTFYTYEKDDHSIQTNWNLAMSRDLKFFNQIVKSK
jgi:dipeptidyl aminopeptidase/acylaminoacyl peptidase